MDGQGHVWDIGHDHHLRGVRRRPALSNNNNECLSVTVSYGYHSNPLFPELPGPGLITPSTISSTNVLQVSTPSGS